MKTLVLDKPCILRLIPGLCGDGIFDDADEPAWDYCPLYTDYHQCSENGDCPHTGCPLHE